MARAKTVENVTFIAPEQLQQQRIDAALADGASGEEIAALARVSGQGEYREYLGEVEVDGKIQADLGELVQWVHLVDSDGNWEADGKYVVYSGDAADYTPQVTEA